jgi:hypothetical protein
MEQLEQPEKQYKNIQQFCLEFLIKVDIELSSPCLIRNYQSSKDNFMNCSFTWTNILKEIEDCKDGNEYVAKIQYLIYHSIICLTDSKTNKWQKYYDMVKKMDLVPISPSLGHFKLMIVFFQKIIDKIEEEPNYFNIMENRLYFTKNELLCDLNFFQLHYLHAVFALENINVYNYSEMFPIKEEYEWKYQSVKVNTPEMKQNIDALLYRDPINCQYQKKYFVLAFEKLLHKNYQHVRQDENTIGYQQLKDLIYIMGTLKYNLDEKFQKFLDKLDDNQICLVG